jgi:hypothetical protein
MAKIELDHSLGITSLSGAISRHRRPDGTVLVTFCTKKGRMYTRVYERTTPVSDCEKEARKRFSQMSREVALRINNGDHRPKADIWKEVKAAWQAGNLV